MGELRAPYNQKRLEKMIISEAIDLVEKDAGLLYIINCDYRIETVCDRAIESFVRDNGCKYISPSIFLSLIPDEFRNKERCEKICAVDPANIVAIPLEIVRQMDFFNEKYKTHEEKMKGLEEHFAAFVVCRGTPLTDFPMHVWPQGKPGKSREALEENLKIMRGLARQSAERIC